MKRKSLFKRSFAALLALCLCLALLPGAARAEGTDDARTELLWEENDNRHAVSYPWVIRTGSANWFLSAEDMELLGEESFCAGLERTLRDAEADFADARRALADYLVGEVPAVDIYTDFAGHAPESQRGFGAYCYGDERGIRLFQNWETGALNLLHEYVHYLSFQHCSFPLSPGFWGEALADYVSHTVCENRMMRALDLGFAGEALEQLLALGIGDPERGGLDPGRMDYAWAESMTMPEALGQRYLSVSGNVMLLTEGQRENPQMTAASYEEASGFLEYLIANYGAELVFAHLDCGQREIEEVYGESFQTLFLKWHEAHHARCEELGIRLG